MSTNKSDISYRLTASGNEILGAIEVMSHYKSVYGMSPDADKFLTYLEVQAFKINRGAKAAAYVVTGVKKQPNINLNALGATDEELAYASATEDEQMNATCERATYEMEMKAKLPDYKFLNKSWQQVRDDILGISDKSIITDIAVLDRNKQDFDDVFGIDVSKL